RFCADDGDRRLLWFWGLFTGAGNGMENEHEGTRDRGTAPWPSFSDPRSHLHSNRNGKVAECFVETCLLVGTLFAFSNDESTRDLKLTRRELLGSHARDHDTAGRNALVEFNWSVTGDIQDLRGGGECHSCSNDRIGFDHHALDDDATATDEATVFDDDRLGSWWFQNAANANATG